MSTGLRVALAIRKLLRSDRIDALQEVDAVRAEIDEASRTLRNAPALEMQRLCESRSPVVCLGTTTDAAGEPLVLSLREAEIRSGGHWLVTGATGAGKSFEALGLIMQLLSRQPRGLVVIDMKGELTGLLRKTAFPSLVASLPEARARTLIRRIAVIAPFDESATPPFQVLARDPSIPIELQASEVASSFGNTIGRDLGVLQSTVLKYALILAIDVGLSLPDVPELLQNDELLSGAVARTSLPEVRAYFANRFPRERAASVASLLSRLDSLLMHPTLKRMLSTDRMIRFDRLLEQAITVIDLGGAPAGMSEVSRFFGQLLFQKIVRAIFARQVREDSPPVTVIADEFQAMLVPDIASDFERVLTLARSQRVFLWCLFQQAAQVEAVSPTLLRILRANTNYQATFRANLEDARLMSHILPVTGTVQRERQGFPDPRTPAQTLTVDEERRILVEQVPSLPDRSFWFWNRRRQYPAQLMRSPTIRLDRLEQRAASLGPARDIVSRGVLALSREELAEAERRRAELRAALLHGDAPARGAADGPGARMSEARTRTTDETLSVDTPWDGPAPEDEPERPPKAGRRRRGTNLG